MRPSVSVVIPVYNAERWILQALQSVLDQTYPLDEILVVDDASTDRSAEIASIPRVTVICLQNNSGEGVARNVGIRCATSDYIAMLDADDYWDSRHIEVLVALLERFPQASVACAATQRFGLKSELITGFVPPGRPRRVFWKAYDDWLHTTIGALFKREALLQVGGFSEETRFSVDYDLWLRLAKSNWFVSTHEVTSFWRWHDNQQSQSFPKQLLAVYYYRHAYWKRCVADKRYKQARKSASRCIDLWLKDCSREWDNPIPGMNLCLMRSIPLLRPSSMSDMIAISRAFGALVVSSITHHLGPKRA